MSTQKAPQFKTLESKQNIATESLMRVNHTTSDVRMENKR